MAVFPLAGVFLDRKYTVYVINIVCCLCITRVTGTGNHYSVCSVSTKEGLSVMGHTKIEVVEVSLHYALLCSGSAFSLGRQCYVLLELIFDAIKFFYIFLQIYGNLNLGKERFSIERILKKTYK